MFAVQHQPVETGQAQYFGADGACQRGPAANLDLVRREGRFKLIREDIIIHHVYLFNSAVLFRFIFIFSDAASALYLFPDLI